MTERLAEIKAKCEQYLGYQGESVGMSEVHAVLSFIHGRTVEAIAEIERLEAVAIVCDVARHLGVAEGKEAAAKIADKFPIVGSTKIGDAIRAEISKLP